MNDWIISLIIAGVEVAITTIVALGVTRWWTKKQQKKDDDQAELERLREEKRQEDAKKRDEEIQKNLHNEIEGLKKEVKADIKGVSEKFKKELDDIDGDLDLMKKAQQKDVRRSLRQDGKLYIDRGWASDLEKTEFDELYWSYHKLGKNGVVDAMHDQVMHLPSKSTDNKGE